MKLNYSLSRILTNVGIIKEEELERMDKIVKEEGWTHSDEIDYNQKLVFSDDESDGAPSAPSKVSQNKGNDSSKRGNAAAQNDRDHKERTLQQQRKDEDNRAGELIFLRYISVCCRL